MKREKNWQISLRLQTTSWLRSSKKAFFYSPKSFPNKKFWKSYYYCYLPTTALRLPWAMFESIRGGNEWSNAVFPLGPHNNFSAVTIKVKRDYTKKVWNGNVPDVFGRWQCDQIGRFLKALGDVVSFKISQNSWRILG